MTTVDPMFIRVARIETRQEGQTLTNASGFFFLHNKYLYLITNRHVVLNEPTDHRPDGLRLTLHTDRENLSACNHVEVPLYLDSEPTWKEHPTRGTEVDLVAVPINDPLVLSEHAVEAFVEDEILPASDPLPLGQDVLLVGFPLGFHDTVHHLPIVRSATIASSYPHPFKGEPYFLTDARMHRGTSGSPVIALLKRQKPGSQGQVWEQSWFLLGVHSASLDVSDRDPQLDERLGLNTAWYAALIPEIITGNASF